MKRCRRSNWRPPVGYAEFVERFNVEDRPLFRGTAALGGEPARVAQQDRLQPRFPAEWDDFQRQTAVWPPTFASEPEAALDAEDLELAEEGEDIGADFKRFRSELYRLLAASDGPELVWPSARQIE